MLCIIHVFINTLLLPIITIITHHYMLPTGQLADDTKGESLWAWSVFPLVLAAP